MDVEHWINHGELGRSFNSEQLQVTFDNINQVACQCKLLEKYLLFKSHTQCKIHWLDNSMLSAVAWIPHSIVLIGSLIGYEELNDFIWFPSFCFFVGCGSNSTLFISKRLHRLAQDHHTWFGVQSPTALVVQPNEEIYSTPGQLQVAKLIHPIRIGWKVPPSPGVRKRFTIFRYLELL